jgi:hypothetical protein
MILQIFSACDSDKHQAATRSQTPVKVLAVDEHQAAIDHAVAGHHAVAGNLGVLHAEVGATVLDKHVPLFEGAFVQQHLVSRSLARGELALGVLRKALAQVCAFAAAAQAGRQPMRQSVRASSPVVGAHAASRRQRLHFGLAWPGAGSPVPRRTTEKSVPLGPSGIEHFHTVHAPAGRSSVRAQHGGSVRAVAAGALRRGSGQLAHQAPDG